MPEPPFPFSGVQKVKMNIQVTLANPRSSKHGTINPVHCGQYLMLSSWYCMRGTYRWINCRLTVPQVIRLEGGRAYSSLLLTRKLNVAIKSTALHVIKNWTQILVPSLFDHVAVGKHLSSLRFSFRKKSLSKFLGYYGSHGLPSGYFMVLSLPFCWLLMSHTLDVAKQSILLPLFFPFALYPLLLGNLMGKSEGTIAC